MTRTLAPTSGRLGRVLLAAGGACSTAVAVLHFAMIPYGAPAYRYFGAGETLAGMAEAGSPLPGLLTAAIAVALLGFAALAFAAAGALRVPHARAGAAVVGAIYTVRGVGLVPALIWVDGVSAFDVVSSLISLGIGLMYLGGLRADAGPPIVPPGTVQAAIDRYLDLVLDRRWTVMIAAVVAAGVGGAGLPRLEFSSDYRIFFRKDNPELRANEDLEARYAKSNNIYIGLAATSGTILTRAHLAAIHRLTQEAWKLPHVTRVDSLTNFELIQAQGDEVSIRELVRDPAALSDGDLARLPAVIADEPLLTDSLVSRDRTMAGVNLTVASGGLTEAEKPRLTDAVDALIERVRRDDPGLTLHVTGSVAIDRGMDIAAERDLAVLIPLMYAVLLAVTLLVMRSVAATVATVLVITFGTALGLGVVGFVGLKLTALTVVAPIIIMTLAVCHCMHVVMNALDDMRKGTPRRAAIRGSLRSNFGALFLTTFTTVAGFITMTTCEVPPLGEMGLIISIGMLAVYLFSISFLPAFLETFLRRVPRARDEQAIVAWLVERILARPRQFMIGYLVVAAACLAFIGRNQFSDNFVEYFDDSVRVRRDTELIAARLAGVHQLYYSVPAQRPGGVFEPEYLRSLDRFAAWLRGQKGVRHVYAVTDTIKRINREMHASDPAWARVPDSEQEGAQYFLLYEMSLPPGMEPTDRVDRERAATRVTVTLDELTSSEIIGLDDAAQAWLTANAPAWMRTRGSSPTYMFARIGERNARSLVFGNMAAWLLVAGLMWAAFRSMKLALLAMIPNTLPQFMTFGIWGLLDGTIGLAVSIVTVMTFGIVEDDTVHSVSKYVHARRDERRGIRASLAYALERAGTSIIGSSLVLGLGFLVLSFSAFKMNANMGLLTSIVIFLAMLGDLLLLPGLLVTFDSEDAVDPATEPVETGWARLDPDQ